MVFITLIEIIFLFIATIVIGFIFSDFLPSSSKELKIGFDWKRFWFACLVAAPGIVLHELGHKFVAIAFGLSAHFELSYFGLGLGLILKLLGSGFILLAPGYVVIANASALQGIVTAASGPLVNLVLWIGGLLIVKFVYIKSRNTIIFLTLTKEINKWLFIFNILPIPPLDGFKIWIPLFQMIF
ncbi:MAG TPA: M50 family metallopeptidase [Candidatus Nanoarchaeia archaeon]|nr:M50 family metallopeptidase [Candidatus Nanoarchaeia archaeon]